MAISSSDSTTQTVTPSKLDVGLGRLRGNLLGNAGSFVVSLAIGVWMTPYLISHLGVATYGLVPLATNITSYMAIITVALSGSVGRFLAVDIAGDDVESANRTFNTSLLASLALAIALLPLVGALAWFGPSVLSVPPGQENAARWLLLSAGLAFLINTVGSNFAASTFARNRLDLQRMADVIGTLTQAACIVILFAVYGASLWQVGLALLAMAAARQITNWALWRRLTPELRVCRNAFDGSKLRSVLGMGGWLTVNAAGAILLLQAELLMANLMLGAHAAGLYAPLVQWSTLLRSLTGVASGVLTPTFVVHYVRGEEDRLTSVARLAVKTLGLAIALPVGLVAGLSEPLLRTWLGDEYAHLWPLLALMTLPLSINLAVIPLYGVNQAMNRLLCPSAVIVPAGLANVALAAVLAGPLGWGLYGIAGAGVIVQTCYSLFFTPVYAAHILRRHHSTFLLELIPCSIGALLVALLSRWLSTTIDVASWPELLATGAGVAGLYTIAAFRVGLHKPERELLKSLLGAGGHR